MHAGVTIGARAVIGCDIEIGRYALVGMGAVVTRAVADHHLVIGNPARTAGQRGLLVGNLLSAMSAFTHILQHVLMA